MREQPSRYKATDGFLDAGQVDKRRDAREWRCSMDFLIKFPWTPAKLTSAIFTLLALPRRVAQLFLAGAAVVRHALVLTVRLCSAQPHPSAGALLAPPCPGADALLALPLPRCRRRLLVARPSCVAGEDEGTQKTASIFGAILSPRARSKIRAASAQDDGSVQRKASRRVHLEARALAVVSPRDGFALSPHYCSNGGGYCKISTWRRRPARPLYVP